MTLGEKAYDLYENNGLRIGVIADRLGVKPTVVSSALCQYRRAIGEPPREALKRQKRPPQKRLVGFAGTNKTDTWQPLGKVARSVLESANG